MATPAYHTSLLTAIDARSHVHLILGTNPLASTRTTQSLAAGATPILIAPPPTDDQSLHYALQQRIDTGLLKWHQRAAAESDLLTLGRPEIGGVVDAVFITSARDPAATAISGLCKRHRIPVNVVDSPQLCSFNLLSAHVDGPLQIGVTTNGRGCKLAGRIRREVAAGLPKGLGEACAKLGDVRRRVQEEGGLHLNGAAKELEEGSDDSVDQSAQFNRLVLEEKGAAAEDSASQEAKERRMRWLSQVCEYWPLKRLASITDQDVEAVLRTYPRSSPPTSIPDDRFSSNPPNTSGHSTARQGRIILAGSGPGHPDLLTRATLRAIQSADLILADKLVPQGVLDLIPRRTEVRIARKFPGNADAAQDELQISAITAARQGRVVLRLKQGDPFIYGRGGEEVAYFRANGWPKVDVLPGVTSALAAPLFAGVPPTQRDVADQVLICTGTGKKGKPPQPPGWASGKTVVFLMALHRIAGLVGELTRYLPDEEEREKGYLRRLWPAETPCAVVERASCPDQKVIRTTLERVVEAIEQEGSRPPGLLVVGAACEVLYTPEKGRSWLVEDGFQGLDLDDIVPQGMAAMA